MILYYPDPLSGMASEDGGQQRSYRMPSGGVVVAEVLNDKQIRINSVFSTDPMDYLNPDLTPGSILDLGDPIF